MYYNPKTKQFKQHREVMKATGASFPNDRVEFAGWHLILETTAPEPLEGKKVIGGEIVLDGGRYTRRWKQVDLTSEEKQAQILSLAESAVQEVADLLSQTNHWALPDYQASRSSAEISEKMAKRKEWLDQLNDRKIDLANLKGV